MSNTPDEQTARRFTRRQTIAMGVVGAAGLAGLRRGGPAFAHDGRRRTAALDGRLIAVGIPGASAVSAVGTFLPGGPIHDNPVLAAFTAPGTVLDPTRILVGARTNFGAPLANADQEPGALLSIAPGSTGLAVPAGFAASGDQATALGGAVQLYSAQSPNWRNGFYNPAAVTAAQTGVSNPTGLSINNAFGRLWPSNAPYGADGPGSSSICDPDGRPLKGAPNPRTGGVYFDDLTGRQPAQIIAGSLAKGADGTAFLGRSPDGSGRAVFVVVVADGSIVQEHTGKALDGLAPAGTVAPLAGRRHHGRRHGDEDRGRDARTPRLGAIVNYTPTPILYVSQPTDDSIKALSLAVGGPAGDQLFVVTGARVIRSRALRRPVDLAPVHVETENPNWSSNTTLEEGSDLYACNAGDNTIARLRQDGTTVAVRRVRVGGRGLGDARLNGIASSPDGTRIWATYVGRLPGVRDRQGGVVELPAF
jgi:hypothetical protein